MDYHDAAYYEEIDRKERKARQLLKAAARIEFGSERKPRRVSKRKLPEKELLAAAETGR